MTALACSRPEMTTFGAGIWLVKGLSNSLLLFHDVILWAKNIVLEHDTATLLADIKNLMFKDVDVRVARSLNEIVLGSF